MTYMLILNLESASQMMFILYNLMIITFYVRTNKHKQLCDLTLVNKLQLNSNIYRLIGNAVEQYKPSLSLERLPVDQVP